MLSTIILPSLVYSGLRFFLPYQFRKLTVPLLVKNLPAFYGTLQVHYSVHINPTTEPISGSWIHFTYSHLFRTHFNIIPTYNKVPNTLFSYGLSTEIPCDFSSFGQATHLSHSPLLIQPDISLKSTNYEAPHYEMFCILLLFLALGSKRPPQHPVRRQLKAISQEDGKSRSFVLCVFEHLQFMVCSQSKIPSSTQGAWSVVSLSNVLSFWNQIPVTLYNKLTASITSIVLNQRFHAQNTPSGVRTHIWRGVFHVSGGLEVCLINIRTTSRCVLSKTSHTLRTWSSSLSHQNIS